MKDILLLRLLDLRAKVLQQQSISRERGVARWWDVFVLSDGAG